MKEYKLFIGCSVKGKDTYTIHDVIRTVLPILEKYGISGATFWSGQGYWKSEKEATVICSIVSYVSLDTMRALVAELRDILRQETIMLISSTIDVAFI